MRSLVCTAFRSGSSTKFYRCRLNIRRTDSWGYKQANGHFDGLVGLLERRVVDFGSSPLIYKLDRMPVVDYSYGNWILKYVRFAVYSYGRISFHYFYFTCHFQIQL